MGRASHGVIDRTVEGGFGDDTVGQGDGLSPCTGFAQLSQEESHYAMLVEGAMVSDVVGKGDRMLPGTDAVKGFQQPCCPQAIA